MSVSIDSSAARAAQEQFVEKMHDLYVEEFRQFLRDAAEQAINEAAEKVKQRLETRAERTFSLVGNAPIINVLYTLDPGSGF